MVRTETETGELRCVVVKKREPIVLLFRFGLGLCFATHFCVFVRNRFLSVILENCRYRMTIRSMLGCGGKNSRFLDGIRNRVLRSFG